MIANSLFMVQCSMRWEDIIVCGMRHAACGGDGDDDDDDVGFGGALLQSELLLGVKT